MLRLKLPRLRMSARSISTGLPQMMFCNLLNLLSIGGLFCGTRLSVSILTRNGEFKFTKGLDLFEFEEGPIAIKRVAYR